MTRISQYLFTMLAVLLLALGCKSSESLVEKKSDTSKVKDSVERIIEKVYIQGATDTVLIEEPCDSNGRLKPIYYNMIAGAGAANVSAVGGNLQIITRLAPISYANTTEYKARDSVQVVKEYIDREVVKTVPTKWTWIWMLIAIVEFLLILLLLSGTNPLTGIFRIVKSFFSPFG